LIISRFPVLDPAASDEGFTVTVTAEGVVPLVGAVVSQETLGKMANVSDAPVLVKLRVCCWLAPPSADEKLSEVALTLNVCAARLPASETRDKARTEREREVRTEILQGGRSGRVDALTGLILCTVRAIGKPSHPHSALIMLRKQ